MGAPTNIQVPIPTDSKIRCLTEVTAKHSEAEVSSGMAHSLAKVHDESNWFEVVTRYYRLFRLFLCWYFKKRSSFEAKDAPLENSFEIAGNTIFTPVGSWLTTLKRINSRMNVTFQVVVICLSAVTCGMATAYPAVVVPGVSRSGTALLPSFVSLVAATYYLTILAGGLASGPLVEKWGRRKFLLAATTPLIAGWLIAGLYNSTSSVLICLMFLGSGTSMTISCIGVYLPEIAPKNWASFSPVVRTTAFFVGVTLTYALGFVFRDDWMKLSIVSASVPSAVFVLGIFYLRETKEWLQRVPQTNSEMSVLKDYMEFWTTLSQRSDVTKPFYTLNILIILRQLSGTAVLIIFSIDLLERIAPGTDPYAVAFVLGLEFLTGCPLGAALSKRFGVRKPLVYSGCLMSFTMLFLAKLHQISGLRNDEWPTYTAESFLACFVLGHAIFYAITEALQERIFPADVRKICTSISTFNSTLASGITVVTYPLMIKCWGYSNVFMLYATANVLCAVLTIAILTGIDKEECRVPNETRMKIVLSGRVKWGNFVSGVPKIVLCLYFFVWIPIQHYWWSQDNPTDVFVRSPQKDYLVTNLPDPASTGDDQRLHSAVLRHTTDYPEHAKLHSESEAEVKASTSDS